MKTRIMLDPGHGGTASGTVHTHPKVKVVEKDINLSIALYTRRYLHTYHSDEIIPYITRFNDDSLSLQRRCEMANEQDELVNGLRSTNL
jgi:N-acetylmuramoyl-L-alanine amidase